MPLNFATALALDALDAHQLASRCYTTEAHTGLELLLVNRAAIEAHTALELLLINRAALELKIHGTAEDRFELEPTYN